MKKKNIGSSFDSWLGEEGIREEVTATAIKRILARQVEAAMKEKNFSKAEMARRMHTSRAALDRLLDPEYEAVTLSTLRKAATAVGRELPLELAKKWVAGSETVSRPACRPCCALARQAGGLGNAAKCSS
jgi:DNA-binding Xre family transcriptional regulator